MPSGSVYLVLPSRMALIAASLMLPGVSKSGSPASSEITSRPAARKARAFAPAAMVADGLMRASAWDWANMWADSFAFGGQGKRRVFTRTGARAQRWRGARLALARSHTAVDLDQTRRGRVALTATLALLALSYAHAVEARPVDLDTTVAGHGAVTYFDLLKQVLPDLARSGDSGKAGTRPTRSRSDPSKRCGSAPGASRGSRYWPT